MMAAAYLVAFFAAIIAGYFARFYETMDPALFWALNAAACWVGAGLFYLFGPAMTRALAANRDQSQEPAILPDYAAFVIAK